MKEAAELEPIAKTYRVIEAAKAELADAQELVDIEDDPEMVDLAKAGIVELEQTIETKSEELQFLLLPKDPNDEKVSWKYGQEQVVMRQPYFQVTYSECTVGIRRSAAGASR